MIFIQNIILIFLEKLAPASSERCNWRQLVLQTVGTNSDGVLIRLVEDYISKCDEG